MGWLAAWLEIQHVGIQLLMVVAGVFCVNVIAQQLLSFLSKKYSDGSHPLSMEFVEAMRAPLRYIFIFMGLGLLGFLISRQFELEFGHWFGRSMMIVVVFCAVWFAIRFIRKAEAIISERVHTIAPRKGLKDEGTLRALSKLLEVIVIVIAILLVLSLMGVSISGLVTFGGVSAAALAFSTKDMMSNLVGGFMMYLDRPFVVGDAVLSPDRDIEGTVESIGWRLTMIRRLDKRPLYIPNSIFNTLSLINVSRMSHRRIYQIIGVRYCDLKVLQAILKEIRAFLVNHAEVDISPGCPVLVNIESFGDSAVNILICALIKETEWEIFRAIQDEILLQCVEVITKHGAECPFPSTTLYVPDEIRIRTV